MKKRVVIVIGITAVLAVCGYFLFRSRSAQTAEAPPQGPPPVPAARCVIQEVENYNVYTGNLASIESVDIRARVEGFLQSIAFTDGAFVKKGDLLFEIEPETYQAERDRARANLESAQSDLNRTQQDYDRVTEAVQSGAVSKQEVTTAKARRDMAQAAVLAAKAALQQAELNLSYTRICSPIDGKISRRFVDAGNLVGATEMTVLANIVQLDPLYVYFYVSESEYLDYQKHVQEKTAQEPNQLPIYINLANNQAYRYPGRLDYMDNHVDMTTGTLQVRGKIPNPENKLYPGMFVQIRVPTETVPNAVLIPEKAVMTDLGGKYVLVVNENNILQRRDITLGQTIGLMQVVRKGLDGSEIVATGSFHMIRPGMPVTPMLGGGSPPGMPAASERNDTEKSSEEQ